LIMKQLTQAISGWLNPGNSSSAAIASEIPNYDTPGPYAEGGYLMGGTPGKDSIPILGMPGEYMIPKDSVDYYGIDLMQRLKNRDITRMAEGGLVGGGMDYQSGSQSGTSISIKLENQGNSQIETKSSTITKIDPKQYVVNVILDDVDSFGPLYQAFKGGR
jgi:hypothetical protein